MKSKFLSLLLTAVLLLPTIMEVSAHLSDHNHEMCNKDGIHFHENEFDCSTCLINKINSEEYINLTLIFFETDGIIDNYKIDLYHYPGNFHLSPLSRGPPENIS